MDDSRASLRIGELAARAGVRVDTVRFYEKRGLLARPKRLPSGYRSFRSEDLERLRFIRRAQELGFTLNEIVDLLRLSEDSRARCGDVQETLAAKREDVRRRIADLQRIENALGRLLACCDGETTLSSCPLLDCLHEGSGVGCETGDAEGAARCVAATR